MAKIKWLSPCKDSREQNETEIIRMKRKFINKNEELRSEIKLITKEERNGKHYTEKHKMKIVIKKRQEGIGESKINKKEYLI